MSSNIVSAARWLGAALVLSSLILVGGVRWVVLAQSDPASGASHRSGEAVPHSVKFDRPAVDTDEIGPHLVPVRPQAVPVEYVSADLARTPFRTHSNLGP